MPRWNRESRLAVQRACRIFVLSIALMLLVSPLLGLKRADAAVTTGIYYPLYTHPGPIWDSLIKFRLANPAIPWLVAINPDSGPGLHQNDEYVKYVEKLKDANIIVLGYSYTDYGSRSPFDIKDEISKYKRWYNVDGIMFDEMTVASGYENYYKDLANYAHSLGMTFTKGNPGVDAKASYVGIFNNLSISEGSGTPSLSYLGGWHTGYDKSNFSFVAYSQNTIDRSYVSSAANYVSYMYMTDDAFPNPYDDLPSHIDELISALDQSIPPINIHNLAVRSVDLQGRPLIGLPTNATFSGAPFAAGMRASATFLDSSQPPSKTLTVKTMNPDGRLISGLWTVLRQGGQIIASGFSPINFALKSGQQYTVSVSDYGQHLFDHWEDTGSVIRERPVTVAQDGVIYAVYKGASLTVSPSTGNIGSLVNVSGTQFAPNSMITMMYEGRNLSTTPSTITTNSAGSFSATFTVPSYYKGGRHTVGAADNQGTMAKTIFADTSPPPLKKLELSTVYANGQNVTGMYTTLEQNGRVVDSGYSPITYYLKYGEQYAVTVYNHNNFAFTRWDDGSTNSRRSISITTDTGINAIYNAAAINLGPSSGTVGTPVVVSGAQFTPNSIVTLTYDNVVVATSPATIKTSSTGAFTASFSIPSSSVGGPHSVSAIDATGVTPLTVTGSSARSYVVTALDHENYAFRHWENGSTARARTITLNSPGIATAYYENTAAPSAPPTATVSAITLNGAELHMWTIIQSGGATVASGFTPLNFEGALGQSYTVTTSDYASFVFDHWENGSTSRARTFTLSGNVQFSAYYRDAASQAPTMTINAVNTSGDVRHMWTTIRSGTIAVQTGFTPLTYSGVYGTAYTVTVSDYQNNIFDHWENGSTSRTRTVTLTAPITMTAYYRTG